NGCSRPNAGRRGSGCIAGVGLLCLARRTRWARRAAREAAAARRSTWAATALFGGAGTGGRLARQQTFPLRFLACELACASDRLGLFAHATFGGLFVVVTKLHLTKDALALHLLLQRLEGLIDVIVANLYQQAGPSSDCLGTIETHAHARARGLAP